MRSIRQQLCDFFQEMPSGLTEVERTAAVYHRLLPIVGSENGITFSEDIDGAFMLDTRIKVVSHGGKDAVVMHLVTGPGYRVYSYEKGDEATLKSLLQIRDKPVAPNLYEATKDLHHACEAHPVGQRMAAGTITPQEWADWLAAFRAVHVVIDPVHPAHLARVALIDADLALLPSPRPGKAAQALSDSLTSADAINAAGYVLHGAHRRGGRVLAATMGRAGLPTAHVSYPLPAEVEAFVKGLRGRTELADDAQSVFGGLLAVMNEIEGNI